jgi:hypothetical protein
MHAVINLSKVAFVSLSVMVRLAWSEFCVRQLFYRVGQRNDFVPKFFFFV